MTGTATIAQPAAAAEATPRRTKVPLVDRLAADLAAGSMSTLALPQHRQLEMYSRPMLLSFAEAETTELPLVEIAGALRAFNALDSAIGPRDAECEGGIVAALPRAATAQRH